MASKSPHRVVILGGGFGGLYAARMLRRAPVQITLVDRRNFHLFQPLLYQVATAALSPANIASPLRYILKRQPNAHVLLAEAVGFDPALHQVLLRDGELGYDSLILATGSENNYFGHADWAEHAPGLKSVEDATEIRRRILLAFETAERETEIGERQAWLTFVIVGAGPTGVELAGSVAEIARDTLRHEFRSIEPEAARIILIDAVKRPLPAYDEAVSAMAQRSLERLKVQPLMGAMVTDIASDHISFERQGRPERIDTHTVLWAAGVQASGLGRALAEKTGVALQKGGRVPVGSDLTVAGHPDIFVIGDLAYCPGPDGRPLPGIAPVAMQQGQYAARLITSRLEGRALPPFSYFHKGDMATIGRAAAVVDFRGLRFSGLLAWLTWLFVHLWFVIEFEDRLLVFTQWAWNYVTRNRSARLITGESHPHLIEPNGG